MKAPMFYGHGIVGLTVVKYPSNDALAVLALVDYGDEGVEETPVSINLDHAMNGYASRNLADGEFYAKSYSEGQPLFEALKHAGWIETTGSTARSGFVEVPACRLTELGKGKIRTDSSTFQAAE